MAFLAKKPILNLITQISKMENDVPFSELWGNTLEET